MVYLAAVLLLAAGAYLFPDEWHDGLFLVYAALISVIVVAACWLKCEPTEKRWDR